MRRFIPYILILVILVGVFAPTSVAHAGWWESVTNPFNLVGNLVAIIVGAVLKLLSFITGLSGMLLDYVLWFTVVDMKNSISGLTGINIAWKILRDLMNIAFVFLLVYEGIKMIIGQSDVGKIKSLVSFIVLASILINFSLFFTKVMIDASNIVTIGFYKSILDTTDSQIASGTLGLSTPLTKALGLTSLWSAGGDPSMGGIENVGGAFIYGFGTGFVMIVSFFVFLAVACLFIVRYIALIILMMLSPIAYMGMALPFMKTYSNQWWKAFNSQLFFGPIYMIMTWVILTLMSSPGFLPQGSFSEIFSASAGGKPSFGLMQILMNFAIIIGLLIASLVIAKKTASEGHGFLKDATNKLSGRATAFAGGALLGGAGAFSRATIGARYDRLANDQGLKDRAAGIGVNRAQQIAAQAQLASYRKLGGSSFDVRRSGMGTGLAKAAGVDVGKGTEGIPFMGDAKSGEGGYKQAIKNQEKKDKEYMESLKPSDAAEEAYKAEAKKKALETLANDAEMEKIKKLDEEARKKYFEEHPEELADLVNARAKLQEAATKALEEKAAVEKTSEETKAQIVQSEANLKKLQEDLKNAKFENKAGTPDGDAKIKAAQDALDAEKTRKETLTKQSVEEKKSLDEKVKKNKEAEEAITKNKAEETERRNKIRSKEHDALLLEKEGKGQTLYQKQAESLSAKYDAAAKRVMEREQAVSDLKDENFKFNPLRFARSPVAVISRRWNGNERMNKARADAIRKAAKGKSYEQQLADLYKKQAKERRDRGEKDEDEETPEVAAPAPAVAPAETPPAAGGTA